MFFSLHLQFSIWLLKWNLKLGVGTQIIATRYLVPKMGSAASHCASGTLYAYQNIQGASIKTGPLSIRKVLSDIWQGSVATSCLQCFDTVGFCGRKGIRPVKIWGDGEGGHWLVRMEWRPAGWSVCLPLLIFPCTIKSGSSLLAPAHLVGPGKRAVKWLWWCGVVV